MTSARMRLKISRARLPEAARAPISVNDSSLKERQRSPVRMAAAWPNRSLSRAQPCVFMQFAEAPVNAGTAPPGIGTINDVVVDQGGGLEQLQGAPGGDHLTGAGSAAGAAPAPVAHQRAEPFAAGDQVGDRSHQRIDVRR